MSDPKCFTCADEGFLICGNCDAFEDLVVMRREDLSWAEAVVRAKATELNSPTAFELANRLKAALDQPPA